MKRAAPTPFAPMSLVMGIAGLLLGLITGYILGAGSASQVQARAGAVTVAASAAANDHVHLINEEALKAFKDILERDPANVKAAVEIANRLYDANRFSEAIPYYQQALALEPRNVNVSTDLGTAFYYAGRIEEELAQFDVSLQIDPAHGQTFFNLGIVRRDAKKDAAGAVAAWEQLLKVVPGYPEAARVRALIADTKG